MRIEGGPGEPLKTRYLWLARGEAEELIETLQQLLRDDDYEAHHHVSSADYQSELTVMLDRARVLLPSAR